MTVEAVPVPCASVTRSASMTWICASDQHVEEPNRHYFVRVK